MTYDEMVEKVVTALLDAERKSMGLPPIEHHIPANRLMVRPEAEAAISTIREVLMEPTPAMEVAVSKNWGRRTWSEYRDVLAASPLGEKKG